MTTKKTVDVTPAKLAAILRKAIAQEGGTVEGKMAELVTAFNAHSEHHAKMRFGIYTENMTDWLKCHPDATEEQKVASAIRQIAMIRSNPGLFKRVRLVRSLMQRTDLGTNLE